MSQVYEAKKRSSFSSPQQESYPFKYDDDFEAEEFEQFVAEKELQQRATEPTIGSKIDEIFDSYLEDSLFRVFYPNPLQSSPVASKFHLNRQTHPILPKRSLTFAIFCSNSSNRTSFLSWQKILYQEALIDASIHTPVDYIIDPDQSHLYNRRSVYETRKFHHLSMIRPGALRSFWRFFCRFSIYFVKGVFAGFGMYATDRYLLPKYLKFK